MRIINANELSMGITLYLAENAYLNDTGLDAYKNVLKWIDETQTVDAVPFHSSGNTTFFEVGNVDEFGDRLILDEGDLSKRCKTYYAEEPAAHWVHCKGKSNLWYCSKCGGKIMYNPTRRTYNIKKLPVSKKNKFCRNCGVYMEGEREEL